MEVAFLPVLFTVTEDLAILKCPPMTTIIEKNHLLSDRSVFLPQ